MSLNSTDLVNANIQPVSYLGSFNPSNISQNYLADAGLSTGIPATLVSYSHDLANGATVVIVVFSVNSSSGAQSTANNYTLRVNGLVCAGSPKTFTITVNPTPNAVATPSSQTTCSGQTITPVTTSGNVTGTVYNWTRDNTGSVTGIAGSGSGTISGQLINNTASAVTVTFTITPTANSCPGTPITATVVVNPDANNPTITCPLPITIECDASILPGNTGSATSTDDCDPNPVETYTDVSNQNPSVSSPQHYNYTITRTWKATDLSGKFAECTQIITVRDSSPPTITCPPDKTVPFDCPG